MGRTIHCILVLVLFFVLFETTAQPAFPGAEGFGANASGGRGGKVIYVTNLNISGPGSLSEALQTEGPRYILFKVSGVIPGTLSVPAGRGDFTLAGQTSPAGIILRGLEMYNESQPSVSNIIIRHIRSRIGDRTKFPTTNWLAEDGITLGGVHNAILDHCSFQHASDEAVDISRSSRLTIQHCILGETLGSHANLGGMLINYSESSSILDSISIHHNIWNRIGGRMPEISCETPFCNGKTLHIELSNNLFWDPQIEQWYEGNTGFGGQFYVKMNALKNVSIARPTYSHGMFHHDLLHFTQNQLFFSGNKLNLYPQYSDYDLFYCCNDFPDGHPNTDFGIASRSNQRFLFPEIGYHSTTELVDYIGQHVGAFPRDQMDQRMMMPVLQNQMLSLPVDQAGADDAFLTGNQVLPPLDGDNDGMPDYWEEVMGSNPLVQDHNQSTFSERVTGILGYTNLECYLNCLSDALVNGYTTSNCQIEGFPTFVQNDIWYPQTLRIIPNPGFDEIRVFFDKKGIAASFDIEIFNMFGKSVKQISSYQADTKIDVSELTGGLYILSAKDPVNREILSSEKFVISK